MTAVPYPIRLEGRLDARLSRWLWLVKWVLIIPHLFVLAFLWAAFVVLSLVAFVSVAFRGRYPRSIFDFNLGVLRWTWRVDFYAYGALGTDRYPPFTLADVPGHPARLEIPFPEHLPRGFGLLKWWIVALPHYVVAIALVGAGPWFAGNGADWSLPLQGGVLTLLALMAGVVLAVTGRYPRQLFDLVLGLNRWVVRAAAYAALMTDAYPPLRLDTGYESAGSISVPAAAAPRSTASRTALVAVGAVAALIGLGLLAGGTAGVVSSATLRDQDGYVNTHWEQYATGSYALTAAHDQFRLGAAAGISPADVLGRVRISAIGERPVFVGIARASAAETYLGGVEHAVVRDVGARHHAQDVLAGGAPATPPGDSGIWAASASGGGRQTVTWKPKDGTWAVVVMNADGSRGLRATLRAGGRLPHLGAIGAGLLGGGVLVVSLAAGMLVAGLRRRQPEAVDA